jgi:hypothetical protein
MRAVKMMKFVRRSKSIVSYSLVTAATQSDDYTTRE